MFLQARNLGAITLLLVLVNTAHADDAEDKLDQGTIAVAKVVNDGDVAATSQTSTDKVDRRQGIAPDIRDDDINLKVQKGNFVVVPIPISNPTFDTGLVVGAAYFYGQTEEEAKVQPASLTAGGGVYTSNGTRAIALAQQNYWRENKWRFTGVFGAADLRLTLIPPPEGAEDDSLDWNVKGEFLSLLLSRKIAGHWYGGLFTRVIDADQSLIIGDETIDFDSAADITAVGIGLKAEYDTRDMPMNSYKGQHFTLNALANDEAIGSDKTYQLYDATYSSYHQVADPLILAWQVRACQRAGDTPLWDACIIHLRGFAATDYLGTVSGSGQAELRWHISRRWGMVGFAGAGQAGHTFSGLKDRETITSYGFGIRFAVLPVKRINLRLDFARSTESDAVYLSVGEAF